MSFLIYFAIIALIPIIAQVRVKKTFKKYSQVPTSMGLSGAEVARKILDDHGLQNVAVVEHQGFLSDHYNPISKTVNLSTDNYHGHSIAGAAVAAHEVGHAIQDAEGYAFLRFRHAMVPVANISANLAWIFLLIGLISRLPGMLLPGIILMGAGVLFQLVTLPVEFNASSRALNEVVSLGLFRNDEEYGARKVLNAAAWTYVAAAAVAVIELLRMILIFTNIASDD